MGLFVCCIKYIRLLIDIKMKFFYVVLLYINVMLCIYIVMLVGYMVIFNDFSELKYL